VYKPNPTQAETRKGKPKLVESFLAHFDQQPPELELELFINGPTTTRSVFLSSRFTKNQVPRQITVLYTFNKISTQNINPKE
jgi:hypothetical protein